MAEVMGYGSETRLQKGGDPVSLALSFLSVMEPCCGGEQAAVGEVVPWRGSHSKGLMTLATASKELRPPVQQPVRS